MCIVQTISPTSYLSRLHPWEWLPLWTWWAEHIFQRQGAGMSRCQLPCPGTARGSTGVTSSWFSPPTGVKVTCWRAHGWEVAKLEMEFRLASQTLYFITMQIATLFSIIFLKKLKIGLAHHWGQVLVLIIGFTLF